MHQKVITRYATAGGSVVEVVERKASTLPAEYLWRCRGCGSKFETEFVDKNTAQIAAENHGKSCRAI